MKIGLLSDTHGYLDDRIIHFLSDRDEIWHAGDFGTLEVSDKLSALKPLRAVYGNVDGGKLRLIHPLHQRFEVQGLRVWITHIGGYPGRYSIEVREAIKINPPHLFITGHSHILKIMRDPKLNLLHINPGAAGLEGSHKVRTMVLFEIINGKIEKLQVVELGKRG